MLAYSSLFIFAYLSGSISSAVIICKLLQRQDPRLAGSKNPGVTNVLRLHGRQTATLTLIGDIAKGVSPIIVGKLFNAPDIVLAAIGLVAFIGHLFPLFYKFKGGKGVATLIGILFASSWLLGFAFVVTWVLMALIFRYSSLAGLTATLMTPVYTAIILGPSWYIISTVFIGILLFWRHQANIKNLFSGTEDKLTF